MKAYILKEKNDASGAGRIIGVFTSNVDPPEIVRTRLAVRGYTYCYRGW